MKATYTFARAALVAVAVALLGCSAAAQEKKITAKQVPAAVIAAFKADQSQFGAADDSAAYDDNYEPPVEPEAEAPADGAAGLKNGEKKASRDQAAPAAAKKAEPAKP